MGLMAYCTVGSNQLPEARAFYDELLASAGITPMLEHPSGGRVYGTEAGFNFAVVGPHDQQPATVGNGVMVGFRFDTREEVDAFYARALALGATDEGAPGLRAPTFYMSYFRDLDGNKLSAYHIG